MTGIMNPRIDESVALLYEEEQTLRVALNTEHLSRVKLFPFVHCCTSLFNWLCVNNICTFLTNTILTDLF